MSAEFEKIKDVARKQFGSATAFRVGIVAGRQGANPLHPYPAGSGRLKSYLDGHAFGTEQREKAIKETRNAS